MKLRCLPASLLLSSGLDTITSVKTVVEIASGSRDFTTLVAEVNAAGLAQTHSGVGPATIFAAKNAALFMLPAGFVASLLLPVSKAEFVAIRTYHVAPVEVMTANLKSCEAPTVCGKLLKLKADGLGETVNEAQTIVANLVGSIGVTHVVDSVILS
jgi:uncharacterized surface protein with fasciclin (FAS1) repeats